MIKALQKRFIYTAMIAVTVLIVVLLGGINIINARLTITQSEELLASLHQQEPGFKQIQPERDPGKHNFLTPPPTEDDRNATLFFVATINKSGSITMLDISHIPSLNEEEAAVLVTEAIDSGKATGTVDRFRYDADISPNDIRYIFMDVSADRTDVLRVAVLSLMAGMVCWGAMLLLVIALSRRAIRPIAENIERQKQFVTDAGHEIKTPLAIILANTEAMELHNGENKWSRNIHSQVLRLNGLMQNLLTLAKAGENKAPINTETFSLSDLTNETLEMFRTPLELRSLSLESQIEPDIFLSANKEQISRLISILTDNAVKYATTGSTIAVTLQKTDKTIRLQTENICDALPQCPPEKLFDRFYRADAARTQQNSGGYGIGLSAAKAIAELHNGTISAKYTNENHITFTVKLSSNIK